MLSNAADQAGTPPLKLIYVVGTYRSGKTVLGALLGAVPGVRTTGEFQTLPRAFWEPQRKCTCGETIASCPFWAEVRQRAESRLDLRALDAGQRQYELYPGLFRLLSRAVLGSKSLAEHVERTVRFTEAFAEVTGAHAVVDFGGNPLRGYVRGRAPPARMEVYYVHLVRDGRGVSYSRIYRSEGARIAPVMQSPAAMSARWVFVNLLASLLCGRKKDRYLRIQLEELVRAPRETLERLGRFLGIDLAPVIDAASRGEPVALNHMCGANLALLARGSVVLRLDDKWVSRFPQSARRAFWLIGGWLARHYGYEVSW